MTSPLHRRRPCRRSRGASIYPEFSDLILESSQENNAAELGSLSDFYFSAELLRERAREDVYSQLILLFSISALLG